MERRAEKQTRKNMERVQLKGWPSSQLVPWPGMFHPNPCGHLINNMNRCSECNSVGKISTRDRARESIQLLIPCPVPIKEPSHVPPKRDSLRRRWAKISMGERWGQTGRVSTGNGWTQLTSPQGGDSNAKSFSPGSRDDVGMTAWTAGHARGLEPTRHLVALALDSLHQDHANCTWFPWAHYLQNSVHRKGLLAQSVKSLPAWQEIQVWSLGLEDPLEKEMATHSSILAWKISWTEELGGLQSTGSQRVGHDWVTNTYLHLYQYTAGKPAVRKPTVRKSGLENLFKVRKQT